MYSKLIATVATITTIASTAFPFFTSSALAIPRVFLNRNCMTYNNAGRPISTLTLGRYYYLVGYGRFRSGEPSAKVAVRDRYGNWHRVNIATRCLHSSQGRVIEY